MLEKIKPNRNSKMLPIFFKIMFDGTIFLLDYSKDYLLYKFDFQKKFDDILI